MKIVQKRPSEGQCFYLFIAHSFESSITLFNKAQAEYLSSLLFRVSVDSFDL